ncbi:MAG: cold shock domain-containing protein [Ilumatobacteraceae bacterium]
MTELDRGTGRRGVVTAFDEQSGLGVVTAENGTDHPFHCIEIADGTRTIEVGAEVSFDLLAKFGRWEAANVGR